MTHSDAEPEPTAGVILAAVLAQGQVLRELVERMDRLDARVDDGFTQVGEEFARVHTEAAEVRRDIAQVREDVLGLKVNLAVTDQRSAELQRWARSHSVDPDAHRRAA